MTSAIQCDQCGKLVTEQERHLHVERRGFVSMYQATELDFCNEECLGDWTLQFIDPEEEGEAT